MFVEKEDIVFKDMGDGITREMLGHGKEIMGCIMTFPKGAYVAPHSHPDHTQMIVVLKGKLELTAGDKKKICVPGDVCYADKNEIHGTLSLEDGSQILDIHTPLRMDIVNND